MPEYLPQYTPSRTLHRDADIHDMAIGFLDCAEWLLEDDERIKPIRGWSRDATKLATRRCAEFFAKAETDIREWCKIKDRDFGSVGQQLYLTRGGSGSDFANDIETYVVGERLNKAAERHETNAYRGDNGWLYLYA